MRLTSPRAFGRVAALGLCLAALQASPAGATFIIDPTGDTFNTGTIDITGTEVIIGSPTTTIRLQFLGAVAAPSAFAPNSVTGFVDLDTAPGPGGTAPWGGPVTGGNNWINYFIPPNPGTPSIPGPLVGMGDEFYVDLGSELFHPGLVDIVSTATNVPVGVAPVTYVGNLVTINLPSALIGSPGSLLYGVLVGDFNAATDRAPNGATGLPSQQLTTQAVPAPAGLLLAVTGVPALGLIGRLRRRAVVAA